MRAKVYLIGAGPGDVGLLTLKGKACLEESDVVVYDGLVNPQILSFAKRGAVKIDVDKTRGARRAGRPKRHYHQDEINRLMLRYCRQGKQVARLKGGDPFMFGRGGEEAEFLAKHRIDFEVVPGVSSVHAVPAYAGIPVTDRRTNSMLTVITGHSSEAPGSFPVDWAKISPQGTLVILMGVSNLADIGRQLSRNGWKRTTPVACVRWGSTQEQQIIIGTLGDIAAKVKKARPRFSSPAVIVVGEVVKFRKTMDWFEKRMLKQWAEKI